MSKVKLLSLFSGIGAFEKALDKLGVDYELEGYSEIDRYANQAYALIHNTEEWMNLGDVTKIDETKLAKDIDLITYGFPCQDISLAGNQKGLTDEDGNKTRSGLVWEATRIIRKTQPKVAIAENVKNLVSKKFSKEFEAILSELDEAGYNNYWKVLNAKEHGIAQNRERVFIVSIRKDIDLGFFEFPEAEELKTRLLDYLEDEVDEKYYLSDKQIKRITQSTFTQAAKRIHKSDGMMSTLLARDYKDPKCVDLTVYSDKSVEKIKKNIVDVNDVANIITANPQRGVVQKGIIQTTKTSGSDVGVVVKDTRNLKEKLCDDLIENGTVKGGEIINHSYTNKSKNPNSRLTLEDYIETTDGIMPTLTTRPDTLGVVVGEYRRDEGLRTFKDDAIGTIRTKDVGGDKVVVTNPPLRIRKLTPKECWRLMGFDDEDHDKVEEAGISNSQRYKMAGNSIVVNVVEKILKNLIEVVL